MHNEDYQNFSSTKLTGKIIRILTKDFQNGKEYDALKQKYIDAFGENEMQKYLYKTEKQLNSIITEQFGESKVKFNFEFPDVSSLLNNGKIDATEQGLTTDLSEKEMDYNVQLL